MRIQMMTLSAVLAGALTASAWAAPVADTAAQTVPLTIPQLVTKLEQAGYRNIDQIELERNHVDVDATDASGQRVELKVDAYTGEVLRRELDD